MAYGLGTENRNLPDFVSMNPGASVSGTRGFFERVPSRSYPRHAHRRGGYSREGSQNSTCWKSHRDHNPLGFTHWLAGAGTRGGYSHGETDAYGYRAAIDKVHMHDMHATILHLLGVDHERLTYRYAGRDFRLTDVYGNVVRELFRS